MVALIDRVARKVTKAISVTPSPRASPVHSLGTHAPAFCSSSSSSRHYRHSYPFPYKHVSKEVNIGWVTITYYYYHHYYYHYHYHFYLRRYPKCSSGSGWRYNCRSQGSGTYRRSPSPCWGTLKGSGSGMSKLCHNDLYTWPSPQRLSQ